MNVNTASQTGLSMVAEGFPLPGRLLRGRSYGSGHINDTFLVEFDQAGATVCYILQRINHRVFKDVPALMDNISRVTTHLARRVAAGPAPEGERRRVLTLVPAVDGGPYHRDECGGWWRCYIFIANARTYDIVENPRQAREAARAFGEFQEMLTDLPGARLHDIIPFFHHTRRRFETLRRMIEADPLGRAKAAAADIDFALSREPMVDTLLELQARSEMPERVTHNDTKLNNVMIDANHAAVCVIDLDTVMPGLALYDFGDMVRSATNSAAEDERDLSRVHARLPIFEALVQGYLSAARRFLNAAEIAHLAFSGRLITFEIGMRFLTDHLEGDVYFKTARPGHNLERARNQFALLRSQEKQQNAMEAIVRKEASSD
ncbi:MAG: phosphotransferase enzyme family protein [Opitutaceae bacterium]